MAVEVVTPEEFLGDVIGDLSRRRGQLEGQERRGNALAVTGRGAARRRCSATRPTCARTTQGRATYTMQFEHYEEVPPNIAEEIVEQRTGSRSPLERPAGASAAETTRHASPHLDSFPGSPQTASLKRRYEERTQSGQAEIRARQAARERRHHRSHRPWQDDADGRHHQGALREGGRRSAVASRRSTTLPRRRSAASRSPPRTSSTRPTKRHYAHVDCPGTPTTSRT